jgi:hypothetical protein
MPLNFINKERTRIVTVCDDVKIHIMGLSALQKEDLLVDIMDKERKPGSWRNLSELIASVITRIEGFDKSPMDLLEVLNYGQLKEIIDAVVDHCGMTMDERGNSSSSPEQPTPGSAGNAEKNAEPDAAPASSTQTKTEE